MKRISIVYALILCLSIGTNALAQRMDSYDIELSQSSWSRIEIDNETIIFIPSGSNYENWLLQLKQEASNSVQSIETSIVQTYQCNYNTTVTIGATVFGIGTPVHYRYETIHWVQVGYSSLTTHFEPNSIDKSLSNNDQMCTISMQGNVVNSAGVVTQSNVTLYAYFYANEAQ